MTNKIIRKNSYISQKDFDEAIISLLDKGLVEQINLDNKIQYRLTILGDKISNHIESNPKNRN